MNLEVLKSFVPPELVAPIQVVIKKFKKILRLTNIPSILYDFALCLNLAFTVPTGSTTIVPGLVKPK